MKPFEICSCEHPWPNLYGKISFKHAVIQSMWPRGCCLLLSVIKIQINKKIENKSYLLLE